MPLICTDTMLKYLLSIFPIGNLSNEKEFIAATDLTDSVISQEIKSKVQDRLARDLLFNLLIVDPRGRYKTISQVLNHSFFSNTSRLLYSSSSGAVIDPPSNTSSDSATESVVQRAVNLQVFQNRVMHVNCSEELNLSDDVYMILCKMQRRSLRGLLPPWAIMVPNSIIIIDRKLPIDHSPNYDADFRWLEVIHDLGVALSIGRFEVCNFIYFKHVIF
jgi:hypothetical protein